MTCIIRPIAEKDIEGFHRALDIVARERKYLAFLEAPPMDTTVTFIRRNIEKDYAQFVADAGGAIVGWCDVIPQFSHACHAHAGTLGIGLLPAYRGKGLGRQLMTAAIDKARAQGLTRIKLTVRETNTNAVALYKKLGFDIEGTERNAVLVDGVYSNLLVMGLVF